MIEIKNRFNGAVICTGETIREAVVKNLAYLSGANLRGANLRGAYLSGANLRGAKVAWKSHDLLAELLKRAAGDNIAKLKVAGLLVVCRDKCWKQFLKIDDPLQSWALGVLAEYVQEGDGAPRVLVDLAAQKVDSQV